MEPRVQGVIMASVRDILNAVGFKFLFQGLLLALNAEMIISYFNNLKGKLLPCVPLQPPRSLHHMNVSSRTKSSEHI
jgi:hypothetical protein